jgi:Right handed beta helix region
MWRKHTRHLFIVSLLAFSALTTITSQPSTILAQTTDLCGSTISSDVELTADINCEGDGIRVGGDNLTVNLNGFTLRGPGDDTNTTGIFVDGGHEVRIEGPGMIEFFGTGIKYSDAVGGTISNVQVGSSGVGLLADSSEETQWKNLYVHDNRVGAIDDGSHNSKVEGVAMSSNDVAVHVMGNSRGIAIDFNLILDGKTGIQVDPGVTSAKVFYNTMFRQEVLDMKLPTPLEGVLLGNNNCTASDPAQYCEGRVLPSGQRLNTNECGAGQAVQHECVEALNLPSADNEEAGERGLGTQEHLTPEAQQAADAALQRVMNGTQQNQIQSNDNSTSTSADS